MAIPDDYLGQSTAQPYATMRDRVRDGDILLCAAWDPGSRLIRWATRSAWSHCAIAFRLEEAARVIVLECVEHIGVRAVPLSAFLSRTSGGIEPYPGRIVLARHRAVAEMAEPDRKQGLARVAFGRLGDRFSKREVAKIALRMVLARFGIVIPSRLRPDDEYICSEYVSLCFDAIGVALRWDGRGFIAPADIARDPAVEAVGEITTRPPPARRAAFPKMLTRRAHPV